MSSNVLLLGEQNLLNTKDQQEISTTEVDQLMQDLAFIEQPLIPKRMRSKKLIESSTCKRACSNENTSEEEKRRRKSKDQVHFLIQEYAKDPNWTRCIMKELAKRCGLKPSQVYKWNWD